MKIACFTNDKALWAIWPFMLQFNKYWGKNQLVDIVGFNKPSFDLEDNFQFISLADYNYPVSKWTTALIEYLELISDKQLIIFLEDYWLKEPVNLVCVKSMWEYAQTEDNLFRLDLTADRRQHKTAFKYHEYNGFDIIRTLQPTPYQMSYQCGIFNKENLLKVLVPNETAWQSEIEGSKRVPDCMLVLGTNQYPVHYVPTLRSHRKGLQHFDRFTEEDRIEIMRFVPDNV